MTAYAKMRPLLLRTDPETANQWIVRTLSLLPEGSDSAVNSVLSSTVAGIRFPSPVGLAAGADKNARARTIRNRWFGFVEVGTVTPRPQTGNSRSRVFRLPEDDAVINRMGFPNEGIEAVFRRLGDRDLSKGIVGVNVGANKDSDDRIQDYVSGYERMSSVANYIAVNVSSPNTPGLRSLQDPNILQELLERLNEVRVTSCPIFLKVSPDLTDTEIENISSVCEDRGVDAVIVGNTTVQRPKGLISSFGTELGGLSGKPLAPIAIAALKSFRRCVGNKIPLIGVGGISSARDAYERIKAGASLVQLYTAFTYGTVLPWQLNKELEGLVLEDGYSNISDAIGTTASG